MGVKLAVHQEDVVALVLCGLDVGVLVIGLCGIQIHKLLVLVCLGVLYGLLVLIKAEELAFHILEECKFEGSLAELFIGEHAVLYEQLEVVPLGFKLLPFILEDAFQAVCNLLCDVGGDLLHGCVALEIAAAHVKRDVRGIYDAVKEGHEVRDYVVHVVRDEHLVAVEGDLVALHRHAVLQLREVEDTGEVEGIVYVEVDPEERFLVHGEEGAVESKVILVLELRRCLGPEGFH